MDSNRPTTRGSSQLLHHHLTQQIIGAFYDVYHELNCGFVEGVYQGAPAIRLKELGIRAEVEVGLEVLFHDVRVGWFRADLVVENAVLVELKALPTLNRDHDKQLLNYLLVSNLQVGLLLNFGPTPQVRRLVSTIKKYSGKGPSG